MKGLIVLGCDVLIGDESDEYAIAVYLKIAEEATEDIGVLGNTYRNNWDNEFFLQAFKIIKRKSAKDVSKTMYFIIFPGAVIWLIYGIAIQSVPIITTEIGMIIAVTSILICSYIYK